MDDQVKNEIDVTAVVEYTYNGINHRVHKVTSSETRRFYYNRMSQCVWAEEIEQLVMHDFKLAKKITILLDNLNTHTKGVRWQFTTDDARIKLDSIYPNFQFDNE